MEAFTKQFKDLINFALAHEAWEHSMVECESCWRYDENLYPDLCKTHATLLVVLQDMRNKALKKMRYKE